jgi:hypothetical protein
LRPFEYQGLTFYVDVINDDWTGTPWEHSDGHGPVSEWTRRDKKPGEWTLCEERGSKRYYNFSEAMRIAKKDKWDAPPYGIGSKGERALRAVKADFKYLRNWCNNNWIYAILHVVLLSEVDEWGDAEIEYEEYLGGVEYDYSENGYWLETAQEMASEILYEVNRQELKSKIANRFAEAMECGI